MINTHLGDLVHDLLIGRRDAVVVGRAIFIAESLVQTASNRSLQFFEHFFERAKVVVVQLFLCIGQRVVALE